MFKIFQDVHVRPMRDEDAASICALYNQFNFGPVKGGLPLQPTTFLQGLKEKGTGQFLVALYKGEHVIATMSFHPVSGQKATRKKAIWAGHFFIHPEFRRGTVPLHVYIQGLAYAIDNGYERLDSEVAPTNTAALGLFKRGGFVMTSKSKVDDDQYLELYNYIPYMVRYLQKALHIQSWDTKSLIQETWKFFLPLPTTRLYALDSFQWKGGEVVRYDMQVPGKQKFRCYIDVLTEKVTAIDGDFFSFYWETEKGGRDYAVWETPVIKVSVVNNSHFRLLGDLTICRLNVDEAEYLFSDSVPRDSVTSMHRWEYNDGHRCGEPKDDTVYTHRTGYIESQPVERYEVSLEQGAVWEIKTILTDLPQREGRVFFQFVLRLKLLTESREEKSEMVFPFLGWIQRTFVSASGKISPPQPESAYSSGTVHAEWSLSDGERLYRIDPLTGVLEGIRKRDNELFFRLIPSDLGPPYPGGVKRPVIRPLELIKYDQRTLSYITPANIWLHRSSSPPMIKDVFTSLLKKLNLVHQFTLEMDGRLKVELTLHADATVLRELEEKLKAQPNVFFYIKTFPWVYGDGLMWSVPTIYGKWRVPLQRNVFPFGLHDFEYIEGDVLKDPRLFHQPVSLYERDGWVVAYFFGAAFRLNFGLNWMPQAYYKVTPEALMRQEPLVTFSFFLGSGTEDDVLTIYGSRDMLPSLLFSGDHPRSAIGLRLPPIVYKDAKNAVLYGRLVDLRQRCDKKDTLDGVTRIKGALLKDMHSTNLENRLIDDNDDNNVAEIFAENLGKLFGLDRIPVRNKKLTVNNMFKSIMGIESIYDIDGMITTSDNYAYRIMLSPTQAEKTLVVQTERGQTRFDLPPPELWIESDLDQPVRLDHDGKASMWHLSSGALKVTMNRPSGGSIIDLRYGTQPIVLSTFPKKQALGGIPDTYGGAKVSVEFLSNPEEARTLSVRVGSASLGLFSKDEQTIPEVTEVRKALPEEDTIDLSGWTLTKRVTCGTLPNDFIVYEHFLVLPGGRFMVWYIDDATAHLASERTVTGRGAMNARGVIRTVFGLHLHSYAGEMVLYSGKDGRIYRETRSFYGAKALSLSLQGGVIAFPEAKTPFLIGFDRALSVHLSGDDDGYHLFAHSSHPLFTAHQGKDVRHDDQWIDEGTKNIAGKHNTIWFYFPPSLEEATLQSRGFPFWLNEMEYLMQKLFSGT